MTTSPNLPTPDAADPDEVGEARGSEIAHAAARGVIAAMAMSGMRNMTVHLDIVDETPPQAIARQKTKGLIRLVPKGKRRAGIELAHWAYGAIGGAGFGALPDSLRRRAWSGPLYGVLSWTLFELALAPVLGLKQAKKPRPEDRIGLLADHLLYGLVLSETRRRPRR